MPNALNSLFVNNREWADRMSKERPGFFQKLAQQQSPKYLWIGCSDSRVPANEIVGLDPGKVHVRFDEPPVDAKVYVADLAADWGGAVVDGPVVRDGTGAVRATLGGEVIVRVVGRDAARDRWVLGLTMPV